jgi:hypothetical protein
MDVAKTAHVLDCKSHNVRDICAAWSGSRSQENYSSLNSARGWSIEMSRPQ